MTQYFAIAADTTPQTINYWLPVGITLGVIAVIGGVFAIKWYKRRQRDISLIGWWKKMKKWFGSSGNDTNAQAPIDEIAAQLSVADKVSRRVIHSSSAQQVAKGAMTDLSEYMTIDWATLALFDIPSSQVTLKTLTDGEHSQEDKMLPLDGTPFEWVNKEKQALFIPDTNIDNRFALPADTKQDIRAIVHMPLFYRGAVYGSISIGSFAPDAYSGPQLKLLKHSVAHLAISVQSALLLEKNIKTDALLTNLNDLLAILTSDPELPNVFESFAERLEQVVPFDRLSLALVEGNVLRVIASHSHNESLVPDGQVYKIADTALPWMKVHRDVNIEADFGEKAQFAIDKQHIKAGYRGEIRLPLFNHGTLFATLSLLSVKPYKVKDEIDFLRQLGQYLSTPVESYILYANEKQRISWLTALAHHLRTPLTPISAISQMLHDELEKNGNEQQVRMISSVVKGADNLKSNLKLFWDISEVESPNFLLNIESTDVGLILKQQAKAKSPKTDTGTSVKLNLPATIPNVSIDPVKIGQIMDMLLDNAIEFSPEGSEIKLNAKVKGDDVVISITDLGNTFKEDKRERLLRPYIFSESDMKAFPKLSLRLAICRKLIELHGGQMGIEPVAGKEKGNVISFSMNIDKNATKSPGTKKQVKDSSIKK